MQQSNRSPRAPWPRVAATALVLALSLGLAACSSPEEKVASFAKKGQSYLEQSDLVKARLEFQNALQIAPNDVPSLYGMALIAERNSDWNRAYGLLSKVVELDPANLQAQLKLGKLLLAAGQMDKALKVSEEADKIKPGNADVLALRAAVMFKLGDHAKGVDLAQQALKGNPRQVDALVVLATARLLERDGDGAIKYLDQALAGNDRDVALQLIKVQALEKMKRLDEAEAIFRKLIGYFPENKVLRHMLAQFFMSHGKPQQAEAVYRETVKDLPKDMEAKLELVRFIGQVKGQDAAASELQGFIQQEPKAYDLKLMLANLRVQQKQPEQAQALWREVMADAGTDPAGLRARDALAADLLGAGKKPEANALIAEVLKADARNEQALLLRAGVAMDERRLDDAVADLRTVLRDAPSSAQAHALLGRALEMQGTKELAQEEYARAAQEGKFAPIFAMPYSSCAWASPGWWSLRCAKPCRPIRPICRRISCWRSRILPPETRSLRKKWRTSWPRWATSRWRPASCRERWMRRAMSWTAALPPTKRPMSCRRTRHSPWWHWSPATCARAKSRRRRISSNPCLPRHPTTMTPACCRRSWRHRRATRRAHARAMKA